VTTLSLQHRDAYRFGPFHLDVRERRLSRGGDVMPLRLKVFDTLRVLSRTPDNR
jgi:DNA-binding winged helix-turn-helix (wHTH) protein